MKSNPTSTLLISLWKYAGAYINLKGPLVNSYLSVGVTKADLGLALAESPIW